MTPEQRARVNIDRMLKDAGWSVQDNNQLNLGASLGVAVREFPLTTGYADYLLFVDRKAYGVIEAKAEGVSLTGVAEQSQAYVVGAPADLPKVQDPLPFAYESTGVETFFRDLRDPYPRSRRVFAFHKPETLQEWIEQGDTLRTRLTGMPPLVVDPLRECQIEAIQGLELSLKDAKPRSLIQMASGAGKTYTSVSFIYRLIKFAKAKRVLFLVDRSNLGRQTLKEFQQYVTPDDGRKFTELYNVQHLSSNKIDPVCKVCITTIQRLYSMLKGEDLDPEAEEKSDFENTSNDDAPSEVVYNPGIPIETFDFIITDECHRSIYNLWRPVLEYFDGFTIGLTATPAKQTFGFFNQNLVMEYTHERAVADGVNVGYEVYRIKTKIGEEGSKIEAGYYVDKRDKLTRRTRWEQLDEDLEYSSKQLDRDVVSLPQIRTVIKTFKDNLFTEIFPNRTQVPKTLIFAKDDSHADDIVKIVREEFGKGNDFCQKITYRTAGNPEDLIRSFRNSPNPRVAVTVDMISTGTDIRALECLIFMRSINSKAYFEQMKGRGSRVISDTQLQSVTGDAQSKTHFVIVDAIGVCENDKTESRPLERKRTISFENLLKDISQGKWDDDRVTSLAGRLARLDRVLTPDEKDEIKTISGGKQLKDLVNQLLDAVDPDKQIEKAKEQFETEEPTDEQIEEAKKELTQIACTAFDDPNLRNKLIEQKKQNEQIIDTVSVDTVISAGFDIDAKEKAMNVVESFKDFIENNKDELTALQILYNKPHSQRHVTYAEVKQLAESIKKPPYHLTPETLWKAYEQLEKSKVKNASAQKILTDMISLVRFAVGQLPILEPYMETVNLRFEKWIDGKDFNAEQVEWLKMIKDHIATSLAIEIEDFEYAPFHEKGGAIKVYNLFGDDLNEILNEMNEVLVA